MFPASPKLFNHIHLHVYHAFNAFFPIFRRLTSSLHPTLSAAVPGRKSQLHAGKHRPLGELLVVPFELLGPVLMATLGRLLSQSGRGFKWPVILSKHLDIAGPIAKTVVVPGSTYSVADSAQKPGLGVPCVLDALGLEEWQVTSNGRKNELKLILK